MKLTLKLIWLLPAIVGLFLQMPATKAGNPPLIAQESTPATPQPETAPATNQDLQYWLNRGQYLLGQKQYEEALKAYEQALNLKQDSVEALTEQSNGVRCYEPTKRRFGAVAKAVEIQPDSAGTWFYQGLLLKSLDQDEEANKAFDKAIEINKNWGTQSLDRAWSYKGSVLWQLKRKEEAIAAFDKAVSINPEYALAWYNKGTALLQLGQYENAVESYDRALASKGQWGMDTGPTSAWYNRGLALEQLGRFDDAAESYDRALRITPNHLKARQQLAKLRRRLGER